MLQKIRTAFRKPVGVVAISFGLIPFMGPKQQPYEFNFDQTINFASPGQKWPVVKLLSPVEKQVLQEYGRPDFFRLLWNRDGQIAIRGLVEQEWRNKNMKLPSLTWVYVQRNEEVVFSGNQVRTQPLTELIQLTLKSGDPENVKDIGNGVTQWTYYSTGKMYTIAGDRIVDTKTFPAMGSFHK